jgi:hypothetical protein
VQLVSSIFFLYFKYVIFITRALTNSGMLPVCFLLPVVLLFLAFLFLCFSHTLFTQSPSLSLSLHPLLKRTHRSSKKFYVFINTSSFLLLFFCSCMSMCIWHFFFFCHRHCLNYVTTYSLVRDNFFLIYE